MTPDDLAAIRARDQVALFTSNTDIYQQAIYDRRALLAEVDRLQANNDRLREDRWENMPRNAESISVAEAREAERDRIRAAVEGLPVWDKRSVPGGKHVHLKSVLAVIEGEET